MSYSLGFSSFKERECASECNMKAERCWQMKWDWARQCRYSMKAHHKHTAPTLAAKHADQLIAETMALKQPCIMQ